MDQTIRKFGRVTMISKPYQVSDVISQDIRTVDTASDWLIANMGTVIEDATCTCMCLHTDMKYFSLNSNVEKYFTHLLRLLVKYFSTDLFLQVLV